MPVPSLRTLLLPGTPVRTLRLSLTGAYIPRRRHPYDDALMRPADIPRANVIGPSKEYIARAVLTNPSRPLASCRRVLITSSGCVMAVAIVAATEEIPMCVSNALSILTDRPIPTARVRACVVLPAAYSPTKFNFDNERPPQR